MSGIEGKKGYYLQKTGARVNELLERHYIVPTFTTSPTEDTLSWDDDGHIVYFRVGEIIRVKTSEGYDFYRVNDIKDNKINWAKIDTPSDTYTKDEIDVKFFTKEDASGYISEKLVNYYSKREVDGKIEQTNKSVLEQTERVDNLGVELKNKASAEQVNKLESGLETTKKSIAEQTTKVTALQSEIKTKASTQSVTQLGDSVNIISDTVAEQTIRTDELEASIETKVSQEIFDATTGDINSEFIAVKQTTDAIETAVKAQSGEITAISESVNGLSISLGTIESDLDSLRNQMDGTTESYFEKWIPTNENEPAKTWIEQGKQAEHKGDTFTNTSLDGEDAGKSWRWLQDDNGNWGWQPIADTDALKALEAAAKAQAAADGKVTIYYEQPSNYKKGDIWFVHNNSYSPYKQGEILSAKTENTVFYISDWESKTRYTQAVEDLNDVMITTFKDGVLTEAERISIIESITSIANEQAAVQARYNIIIINANLTDETLKNEFKATKVAYDAACTSLINIVEQIADAKEENLESLFDSYTQLSDDYSEAYATHNEKESEINNALMGRLNPANVYIDNITDDGILTPIEKEQLFEIYRSIAREYDATRSNAFNYKVWKYSNDGVTEESGLNGGERRYESYVAFKNAYTAIANVFSSSMWGFTKMDESTTLPEGYTTTLLKSYLDTYYEAYGILTESFSAITAAIEAAQKATEATLKGLTDNLLPEEMTTTVGKGVVLSTIIATKDVNGNITAGMNASSAHYNPEHGRVVFVGGAKDISDFNNAPYVVYEDGHVKMESADIAAYASRVEMYTSLASKADISSFNEIVDAVNILKNMWRFEDVGGTLVLKSEYDVITNGQFAAATVGAEGGGGAAYLSDLYDVSLGSLLSGDILSWNGSEWVNIKQSSLVPDLSGYLSKSGGTIEGGSGIYTPLTIKNTSLSEVWVGFQDAHGTCYIGSSNGVPSVNMGADNKTLIHSGNYSDYALPLTGGTVSGVVYIKTSAGNPLQIFSSSGVQSGTAWFINDTPKSWFGYDANGTNIYDYAHAATLGIATDGVPKFNNHTLIHSGNIGDYAVVKGSYPTSGGNYNYAFESGIYSTNAVEEDLPISEAGNFVVNAQYDSKASAQLYMRTSSDALYYRRKRSNVWYDWKTIAFTDSNVASADYATSAGSANVIATTYSNQSINIGAESRVRLVSLTASNSTELGAPHQYVSGLSVMSNYVGWQLVSGASQWNNDDFFIRKLTDNGTYLAWRQLAFTDSNVASATKLATPRTIWGQSFDGTGNVSGNLQLDGELSLIGGYSIQSYNSAPLSINAQGNNILLNEKGYSNVLIGTTIDSGYMLNVNGNIGTSGELFLNNNRAIRMAGSNGVNYNPMFVSGNDLNIGYDSPVIRFGGSKIYIGESGNVLIGTTSDSGHKLQVNGTVNLFGYSINNVSEVSCYDSGTGYFVGKRNSGLGATDGGLLLYTYGATPMSFYINGVERMRINTVGSVLIGSTTDNGAKLQVGGDILLPNYAAYQALDTFGGRVNLMFLGNDNVLKIWDNAIYVDASKRVGIGVIPTSDNGAKLQVAGDVSIGTLNLPSNLVVNGNTRIYRRHDNRTYLDIICEDVFVNYEAYDTDGFCSHVFKSNGSDILTLYGNNNSATFWGSVLVSDTLTAQNGIVTNEITIGGIKLDVVNGALRVNGDIFSTGQFAASVAGEATGGNIVLDYASIVNALGYTPANNNNLAQVAFTGSYADLSNKPTSLPASDVYSWAKASVKPTYSWSEIQSRPDVYTKQEVDDKLSDIGGGEGCNCDDSTSGLGDTIPLSDLNGNSYDVPNGVNCVMVYESVTLNFSNVIPLDPSRPCIMYLVKTDDYTLQVTYSSNITSANSSGGLSEQFSVNGYTGMMLVWDTDYWKWHAYIQKM